MAFSWEIDLFFKKSDRRPENDEDLEPDHYHGKPVYRKSVEADSFEHGTSGTLALYYKDDENRMVRTHSIKDSDLIGVDANRVGEPDVPDPEDVAETEEEWDQETA